MNSDFFNNARTPRDGGMVTGNSNHTPVIQPSFEGDGPAYPDSDHTPVTQPSFEGDGPAYPDSDNTAVTLPSFEGDGPGYPIIPLPNPGEGGIITIMPDLNLPCFFCGNNNNINNPSVGKTRFLNAAYNYNPFKIYINRRLITNRLGFASITRYGRVSDGFQTITVADQHGYVYLQKTLPFRDGDATTIAIVTTASGGLDLLQISDTPCTKPYRFSCLRACNLANQSRPLDVLLNDGRVVFSDVRFKEVTAFRRVRPNEYQFYIAETTLKPMPRYQDIDLDSSASYIPSFNPLVSFDVNVRSNSMYTIYILNWNYSSDAIQTMIVEDRL